MKNTKQNRQTLFNSVHRPGKLCAFSYLSGDVSDDDICFILGNELHELLWTIFKKIGQPTKGCPVLYSRCTFA